MKMAEIFQSLDPHECDSNSIHLQKTFGALTPMRFGIGVSVEKFDPSPKSSQ